MNTYLFYDIETTGLNRVFDQVLEFACIRTTLRLEEIERHTIRVRLRPDVIPSPAAMLTHRIPLATLFDGECEFEAAGRIHALMNRPGTASLGYNTLGFDDEFLRFTFYRNFLSPYTHQFDNGCGRMDLFPMAVVFWLYRQDVLRWPQKDGTPSLKLENLNAANHLSAGRSHAAMADVEASLELARRFFKAGETWRYLCGCFQKQTDQQRMDGLPVAFHGPSGAHRLAILVDGSFGAELNYQAPVISLGRSIPYSNQTLWLRIDLPELRETHTDTIADTTWVVRKKAGEPGILLPPHRRYWQKLHPRNAAAAEENRRWLQRESELFAQIIRYHRHFRYPPVPGLDADAALYETGFLSPAQQRLCSRFRSVPADEKLEMRDRFEDPRICELARRVIYRNFPQLVPRVHSDFTRYMAYINPPSADAAPLDYRGDRRQTARQALAEIKGLRERYGNDSEERKILDTLQAYIEANFGRHVTGSGVSQA